MAQRDVFFKQFGPKLVECLVDFLLDTINELRQEQGGQIITKEDYLTLLSNHITEIEPYEWETENEPR